MKLPLTTQVRSLVEEIIENGDFYGNYENETEVVYLTYTQLSEELGNDEMEELENFTGLGLGEDDLGNLFKLILLYDTELDKEYEYRHGEFPFMMMKDYLVENGNNLIFESPCKFKEVIPMWMFKYCLFSFEVMKELPLNDFLHFLFLFLSHFDKRYWDDESLCPKWGEVEGEIFNRFVDELEERLTQGHTIRPLKQIDMFELFKLLHERLGPDIHILIMDFFSRHVFKFIMFELEHLKSVERNASRTTKFTKLLCLMKTVDCRLFFADIFRIIGDSSESLDIRELAIDLIPKVSEFSEFLLCLKCCNPPLPDSIRHRAFTICSKQSIYFPDDLSFEDITDLGASLSAAAHSFQVENVIDAEILVNFFCFFSYQLLDAPELELVVILNKITKYIHEFDYSVLKGLKKIIGIVSNKEFSHLILPGYLDEIKDNNNCPPSLVHQLAVSHGNIKKIMTKFGVKDKKEILEKLLADISLFIHDYWTKIGIEKYSDLNLIIVKQALYLEFPPLIPSRSNIDVMFERFCNMEAQFKRLDGPRILMYLLAKYLTLGLPIPGPCLEQAKNKLITNDRNLLELIGLFNFIDKDLTKSCFFKYLNTPHGLVNLVLSNNEEFYYTKLLHLGILSFIDDLEEEEIEKVTDIDFTGIVEEQDDFKMNPVYCALRTRVMEKLRII